MIKCIVIDDQIEAIEVLTYHIEQKMEFDLVGKFTNPLDAIVFLENNKIDLVFIDIQMPHLNGIEFIESMRAKKGTDVPKFIFTTGSNDFALSGYEHGVSDYLLKPIGFKRFNISVDRLLTDLKKNNLASEIAKDFFFADVDGKKVKITTKDIAYIEGSGNYVTVYGNNLKLLLYKSLGGMQEILDSEIFVRTHKSYMVSIDYIEALKGNQLSLRFDNTAKQIPIGATFKDSILKKLRI